MDDDCAAKQVGGVAITSEPGLISIARGFTYGGQPASNRWAAGAGGRPAGGRPGGKRLRAVAHSLQSTQE